MIKKIKIKNFQSHKNTEIEFEFPGVNVIVGESDAGKTSILRALNWVVNNRPNGIDFIRAGSSFSKVTVITEEEIACNDPFIITRCKGKKNYYRLKFGEEDFLYKAFGSNPPEEISRAFNMTDINFQRQMDSPFLLSLSSGEAARYINKIVRLDIIDKAQSQISKEEREKRTLFNGYQETEKELKQQLKKYRGLNKLDELLLYVEALERKANKLEDEIEEIEKILDSIQITKQQLKKVKNIGKEELKLNLLEKNVKDRELLNRQIQILQDTLKKIQIAKNNKKQLEWGIKETDKELHKLIPNVCPFCKQPIKNKEGLYKNSIKDELKEKHNITLR